MATRDTSILEDKNINLQVGKHNFGEGPDVIVLEVDYNHECKMYYLNNFQDK